jgi:hypothetical protein
MRTKVVLAALLLAACAGDGQTVQPVLSTQKVVYAHACPQPEKLSALCAAKPTQEACESVSLCQWAAAERSGRPCRRRACRTPNIQP